MIKLAIATLAITLTISVSAQNTKSMKENNFTNKLSHLVKENLNNVSNEIAYHVKNIQAAIQYKPAANFEYASDVAENNVIDLSELELTVKFSPSINVSEMVEMGNNMNAILQELSLSAKYTLENENELSLNEIQSELAEVVKFHPEA